MSENVLILGAGFSFDAGIPLIGNFAETMYDIAARKSYRGVKLGNDDIQLFEKAVSVRNELDKYHGRANFDERNIEDILSILAFNAFANDATAAAQLEIFKTAIARTIELSCTVHHPGILQQINYEDPQPEKSICRRGQVADIDVTARRADRISISAT